MKRVRAARGFRRRYSSKTFGWDCTDPDGLRNPLTGLREGAERPLRQPFYARYWSGAGGTLPGFVSLEVPASETVAGLSLRCKYSENTAAVAKLSSDPRLLSDRI